ncbi:MAG TPA: hypothetical protein VLA03_07585, partial [Draconibacterium sp.]|nr:hypothetical protein [Draconibacterium sp.]
MKKITFSFIILLFTIVVSAQPAKRPLTHDDILKWERITETLISNDGKTIVYKQEPWKGDPTLKITAPKAEEIASIKCGTNAQITSDSKFVIFTIKPIEDTIRALKLNKTKKEDLPINKLAIFNLKDYKIDTIDELISVKVPEKWANWIAYQTKAPEDTTKKAKSEAKSKDEGKVYPLFVRNLNTGERFEFPAVNDYVFAEEKEALVFISEGKDSTFEAGIYHIDLPENNTQKILDGKGKFKQLIIDKTGKKVAFVGDISNEKKKDRASYSLYYWNNYEKAEVIANNSNSSLPENWEISEKGSLSLSENGKRLFFGTAPKKAQKDTTILEEEIPVLDIWHWNEEELQSAQIINKNRDSKKSYDAVFHLDSEKLVQLETQQFSGIRQINNGDSDKLVAWSNRPYAVQSMWEGSPTHNDFYLVDIKNGETKMIKKDVRATPQISPEGKYLYWYNAVDTSWNTYNIETGEEFKITSPQIIQCADELHDTPNMPGSYRTPGWITNDESLLVYDRFDIWKVDPENKVSPVNLTQNGRQNNIRYRLVKLDEEPGSRRFGSGD